MSGVYSAMRCYAFPEDIAGRMERGIFAMFKAFGWFDDLYHEHLAKFGDVLAPMPDVEITSVCLSAWTAFDNDIANRLGELQSWMEGSEFVAKGDGIEMPTGPVRELIESFSWQVVNANAHTIGLLYLAEKLEYMPKNAASFAQIDDEPELLSEAA